MSPSPVLSFYATPFAGNQQEGSRRGRPSHVDRELRSVRETGASNGKFAVMSAVKGAVGDVGQTIRRRARPPS